MISQDKGYYRIKSEDVGLGCVCGVLSCSVVSDSKGTLWAIAYWAPLSMGFSRQKYWSTLPFPPPGDFPDPGLNLCFLPLLHWQADSLPLIHLGSQG